jgi:hypothetical protein
MMTKRRYRFTQALAAVALVGALAIPAVATLRSEAPGGMRHTVEWHGTYDGCRHTGGWAKRVWRHDGTQPGPERDPNYPGQKMWDFRCKRPVATVTVTQTVSVPAPGGGTATVTVTATPTHTQTPSPTTTPSTTPTCEPSVRSDHEDECEDD